MWKQCVQWQIAMYSFSSKSSRQTGQVSFAAFFLHTNFTLLYPLSLFAFHFNLHMQQQKIRLRIRDSAPIPSNGKEILAGRLSTIMCHKSHGHSTNALGTHCCYRTVTSAGFCAYRVVYFVINLDFLSVFQHCSTTLILVNKVLRQNGTLYLASNLSDFSISMFQECDKWLKEYEPIKNNSSSEKTTKEIVFKQL